MSLNSYDMPGLYGQGDVYPPKDKEDHLSCPFAKHDRVAYESLSGACTDRWGFPNIARVNEHIKKKHPADYARIKDWQTGLFPNATSLEKWNKIYLSLFPKAKLPLNPYYDFLIPLHRTGDLAAYIIASNNKKGKAPAPLNDPSSSWYHGQFSSDLIRESVVSQRRSSDDSHLVDSHDSGISMGFDKKDEIKDSFTEKRLDETLQAPSTCILEDIYDGRLWSETSPLPDEQPTFHPDELALGEESEDEYGD